MDLTGFNNILGTGTNWINSGTNWFAKLIASIGFKEIVFLVLIFGFIALWIFSAPKMTKKRNIYKW
jgi:hypothetical protein